MKVRKILARILSLCVIVTLLPTMSMAADGEPTGIAVATIGDQTYETLAEAIAGASDGDTITLTAGDIPATNSPLSLGIGIGKNLTIQGAGVDQTTLVGVTDNSNFCFTAKNGATVTFKDMTVSGFGDTSTVINADAAIFKTQSVPATAGTKFIAENLNIEKFHRAAFAFFAAEFEINNCVIDCANENTPHLTKGIQAGNGTGILARGTVTGTTIKNADSTYPEWPSAGIEVYHNADLTIDGCTMENVQNGISVTRYYATGDADATATVKNTTISAANNALEVYGKSTNPNTGKAELVVESGDYTGGVDIVYADGATDDKCKIIISGGYFTSDPGAYVTDGKAAVTSDKDAYTSMVVAEASVVVTFDSDVDAATYTVTDVGNTTLPTASKSGYRFTGWKFTDIDGTYKELNATLWQALTKNAPADGSTPISVTATAQFEDIPSSGGSAPSSYTLAFEANGGSKIAKVSKTYGTTVDLTGYQPTKEGYDFAGWYSDKALTTAVTSIKLTSNTTVYAKWTEEKEVNPFSDVSTDAYYYDAVLWAVEKNITSGTTATTFSPDGGCTRAHAVTFLWRAMGSPEPAPTVNPFKDVSTDAYYYEAFLWAVGNGVTIGTSSTTFSPDVTVTRAQLATLLWRAVGKPAATTDNPFSDVGSEAYYYGAVLWAVEKNITSGTTATTFNPDDGCTRAQIVTFLFRYLGK